MKKQDDDESKHLEQQDHNESKHLEHKMTPPANSAKRKQPGEERMRVKLHTRGFFAEKECVQIDEGTYGEIYRCNFYVRKVERSIPTKHTEFRNTWMQESSALIEMKEHEHVVDLFDVSHNGTLREHNTTLYIAPCEGNLVHLINNKNNPNVSGVGSLTITSADLSPIMFQLLLALRDLHEQNIIHADIKLENILYRRNRGHSTVFSKFKIYLSDFGLSMKDINAERHGYIVTEGYKAPELTETPIGSLKRYSFPIDVWAMGVVFLKLMIGSSLFMTDVDLYRNIRSDAFWTNLRTERKVNERAIFCCRSMLHNTPTLRATAHEALESFTGKTVPPFGINHVAVVSVDQKIREVYIHQVLGKREVPLALDTKMRDPVYKFPLKVCLQAIMYLDIFHSKHEVTHKNHTFILVMSALFIACKAYHLPVASSFSRFWAALKLPPSNISKQINHGLFDLIYGISYQGFVPYRGQLNCPAFLTQECYNIINNPSEWFSSNPLPDVETALNSGVQERIAAAERELDGFITAKSTQKRQRTSGIA